MLIRQNSIVCLPLRSMTLSLVATAKKLISKFVKIYIFQIPCVMFAFLKRKCPAERRKD